MEPQILVLDEPTSALDPEGAATVRRIVADLSAAGRTVVMVDHDPDAVAAWKDILHQRVVGQDEAVRVEKMASTVKRSAAVSTMPSRRPSENRPSKRLHDRK